MLAAENANLRRELENIRSHTIRINSSVLASAIGSSVSSTFPGRYRSVRGSYPGGGGSVSSSVGMGSVSASVAAGDSHYLLKAQLAAYMRRSGGRSVGGSISGGGGGSVSSSKNVRCQSSSRMVGLPAVVQAPERLWLR